MKTKLYLSIILLCSFSFQVIAQSEEWLWAKSIGGIGDVSAYSTSTDLVGNVYTTGSYEGTVDFDPNEGVFNLTSSGGKDIFILKLDAAGNFVWAKKIGGSTIDGGSSIAVGFEEGGYVYTTGHFTGTVDFDPGSEVFNLTSIGGQDIFISKLDAAGDFVWAKAMGSIYDDSGDSIALDFLGNGNVYTTGFFEATGNFETSNDFNPGAGSFTLPSVNGTDIFVSKLDEFGNFVWARSMGGNGDDYSESIAIDTSGSGAVYTTGYFTGTADFNLIGTEFNLTSFGLSDIFISKLSNTGGLAWAVSMGGTGSDHGVAIAIDPLGSGSFCTTGFFNGNADFYPSVGVYNLLSNGGSDIFISKLNGNAGTFIWAKSLGGLGEDIGTSIAIDSFENVYTTGWFNGTVDFDQGNEQYSLSSAGLSDIFIQKLDDSGNFVTAYAVGGSGLDQAWSIARNNSNDTHIAGFYSSSAIAFGAETLFNTGNDDDMFVAKLSSCQVAATDNTTACDSFISPSGNYTWTTSGSYVDLMQGEEGCDSIITVNLTITNSTTSLITPSVCGSYTSPSGDDTWTASGTYYDIIPNNSGCDSLITIDLTINSSSSSSQSVTTCSNDYISPSGNYVWTTSGSYSDMIPNALGCDSLITINLTINALDTSVTQFDFVLAANSAGATYQWLDCDNGFAPIDGQINQAFVATLNGNYAVIISQNGCTDTSSCHSVISIDIAEMDFADDFDLFPNPATSEFNLISSSVNISSIIIHDVLGKEIFKTNCNSSRFTVNTSRWNRGVYFVKIILNEGEVMRKVVVE